MTEPTAEPEKQVPAVVDSLKVQNRAKYQYSHVFDALMDDPKNLAGLVAYGFYKQRKRNWIIDFQTEHGIPPTKDQCLEFSFTYRDNALEALVQEAEGTLFRFAENMTDQRKPQLMEEAFNARTVQELSDLKAKINKISGYRHHVAGHVLGFIILVMLAFIFSVAVDYEPHLGSLFKRTSAPPTQPAGDK